MNRKYKTGKSTKANLDSTLKVTQQLWYAALAIANRRLLYCPDFGCSSGLRTANEQFELFKIGRILAFNGGLPAWFVDDVDKVVTMFDGKNKKSTHQGGFALDVFGIDQWGGYDDSPKAMSLIATCFFEAANELNITINWGGNWTTLKDACHFQIIKIGGVPCS